MIVVAAASGDTPALLLELGGVLLGLAVLGRVAARLGLPSIPLYLLAGLSVGEGGVAELFTAREFIEVGAQIGVVLLLLLLGLEYSGDELLASVRRNGPAGAVDLTLNFLPGFGAGLLLGWEVRSAVLLGGVTYISSSGIIAKVLGDLGRTGNRETPTILSLLVIEDLAMAVYLPLVAGLLAGASALTAVVEIGAALGIVAAVLFLAVRFGGPLSRLLFSGSDELLLLAILGITLVVAGAAESVQASAAVGAFIVGLALSGPAADSARQLLAPLRDLFAAVFFVFFGLTVDPAELPGVLPEAAALAVVTAATKVATGWWAARREGIGPAGRLRAGTALVARGEFSVIIAGLAVAAALPDDIGPFAATYVLIVAIAGPVLTRFADPASAWWIRRRVPPPASGVPHLF